jgi:hypothetical protein
MKRVEDPTKGELKSIDQDWKKFLNLLILVTILGNLFLMVRTVLTGK